GFRKPAAGKTGTTNDKRDSWFIGFTPQTLALAWIGFDDNSPVGVSGSEGAVPLWTRYMTRITAGEAGSEFRVPGGIVFEEVDASTGGRATELCPRNQVVSEAFKVGTQPMQECPIHRPPEPVYLDAWGMPILGPDGLPMTDPYYDPAYPPPPTGMWEPSTPTTTPERPAPVLGGGNFPTRGTTTSPPTDTRAPRQLPAPIPDETPQPRPAEPKTAPPSREPSPPPAQPKASPPSREPSPPPAEPPPAPPPVEEEETPPPAMEDRPPAVSEPAGEPEPGEGEEPR
ncbi:MAG: hypothetical protein ABR517_03925, partial [Thermoanaerobaculia bacterium]